MAKTVVVQQGPFVIGDRKESLGTINLGNPYATGGIAVTAADFGMAILQDLDIEDANGVIYRWNSSTNKVMAYRSAAFTPSGSLTITPHADSAGTPSGSVAITPDAVSAGTPAGSVAITGVNASAGTPSGSVAAPVFTATTRSTNYVSLLGDATACDNTSSENVDAAEIASADCVGTYSAVAAGAWAVGALTAPDYARNVAISIKNDSGGPLNLFEGTMTFTVTGTDYADGALVELITFTSTGVNKAVATANYRSKFGVKAFKTVNTVTLDNVPDDGLLIGLGKGGSVSFHGVLKTPAESDVIQVIEDGSALIITGNVDATNGTFDFDTIAGSKVISMLYQVMSGATGTCSAPAFTGNAMGDHLHADTAAFTGNAMGTHSHNDTAAFTGAAMGNHSHADSGSFTGGAVASANLAELAAVDISAAAYTAKFVAKGR